jgi:hypothetical protein
MSFNLSGAMSGAGTGAALGPWGAVAGGLLGGFMGGGDEPEMYSAEDYARDMAPYKEMIDKQANMGASLMNRGSSMNRGLEQQTMANSMDQMGTANILAQRNNAQAGGGLGNSGLLQAAINNNMAQYANQGLKAADAQFMNTFKQGSQMSNNAMTHLGDYQSGLADLNMGNIATMNKYNQAQNKQTMGGMGSLLGEIDGQGGLTKFLNFL